MVQKYREMEDQMPVPSLTRNQNFAKVGELQSKFKTFSENV